MDKTNIILSRDSVIEDNIDIAFIKLDSFDHQFGQPVMVRYYEDTAKTKVNCVFAVGKTTGRGRDCYSIISISSEYVVNKVSETLPDVSLLVHGGSYIVKVRDVWKLVYFADDLSQGETKDIPHIGCIRELESGYNWYFDGTVLKREDDFYTKSELEGLITQGIYKAIPPVLSITLDGGDVYEKGITTFDAIFSVSIVDYLGTDVTDTFTFTVTSDVHGEESIKSISGGKLILYSKIDSTIEYTITATKDTTVLTKTYKVYVVPRTYYASFASLSEFTSSSLVLIDSVLWSPKQDKLEITTSMVDKYFGVYVPSDFGATPFNCIRDKHGLNFTDEYTKTNNAVTYGGNSYTLYVRKEAITINNFKQIFTNE